MELRDVYDRWHGRVLAVARSYLPEAEAEEIAQEVFVDVWKRLEEYQPPRASPWTWIYMIARSRCLDRLRATASRDRTALAVRNLHAQSDRRPAEVSCDAGRVHALVAQLPDEQRDVVLLAYFRGLSHREIALRTGEPLGTVKTRLRLALARLTSLLRAQEPLAQAS